MAKVVDTPTLHPSTCLLCGCYADTPDRKYWMDVEKYAEDWGNIYFCDQCFSYMVREIDPDYGLDRNGSPTSSQEVIALRERLRRCEHHFGTIANSLGLDLFGPLGIGDLGSGETNAPVDSQPEQDNHGTPEPIERTTGEQSEATVVSDSVVQPIIESDDGEIGSDGGNVQLPPERPTEPFRGSVGSLPIIATEFGMDEGDGKGFVLGNL